MSSHKKTGNEQESSTKLIRSAFSSDNLLAFVYKKAERLSVAVYMMTSFLPEEEPIRSDLREKSLALLRNILALDGSSGEVSVFGSKTLKNFFEIASTLDVAVSSGMISQMNYGIVREVISELSDIISNNFDIKNTQNSILNPKFFSVKDIFLNEDNKGQEVIKDIYKGQYYKRQNVLYKRENSDLNPTLPSSEEKEVHPINLSSKAKNRRTVILNLLENKPRINISDISKIIIDCSEKTIQRDLSKMVKEGILEKEGERRWSTYKLLK